MQTKIEGLILSKMAYRERDLLLKILLRNGKQISVVIFGGQGGGKKKKPSQLEVGYMLKLELSPSRSTDLYRVKEWSHLWTHQKIRYNFRAYYLLCFYLDFIGKVAMKDELYSPHSPFDEDFEGVFRILSNAIFYLEEDVTEVGENLETSKHLFLFLSKLLVVQGVFPQRENCILCEASFYRGEEVLFIHEQGGFACEECSRQSSWGRRDVEGWKLYQLLGESVSLPYKEYQKLTVDHRQYCQNILDYSLYQFQLPHHSFKSTFQHL